MKISSQQIIFSVIIIGSIFFWTGYHLGLNYEEEKERQNKIPYEQSYEYLFDRVDNHPSHIIRTDYYGREYFTIPVLVESCGVEDYVNIIQQCKASTEIKFHFSDGGRTNG